MAHVGIVGSGIAGLHLGLSLRASGHAATIYAERTAEAERARRLPNMVARNGVTRARERQLAIDHWDLPEYDMGEIAVRVGGPHPIAFSGRMPAAQAVDMRLYVARLLENFADRGGEVVVRAVCEDDLEGLSIRHDLVVVATGRAHLSRLFPRVAAHSPFTAPQRLAIGGLFRGIAPSEPRSLEVNVSPGHGEILVVPIQSFEPGLTGLGVLAAAGGQFDVLRHRRYDGDPGGFIGAVLELLRVHAPVVHARVDPGTFGPARPQDLCYAAITPTVRRGFVVLPNGRPIVALGDAHVVIDPITGQGANNAVRAAEILGAAIDGAGAFDVRFCEQAERDICAYVVPVSDAANARVQPPSPEFRALLGAAARNQAVADAYGDGYCHPDRFWAIASSAERTAAFLRACDEPAAATGPALSSAGGLC